LEYRPQGYEYATTYLKGWLKNAAVELTGMSALEQSIRKHLRFNLADGSFFGFGSIIPFVYVL
jgi:hypothetical protein